MSSVPNNTPESASPEPSRKERMTIRRAPNLLAFLITGMILGAVAGFLFGLLGPESQYYTRGAIVGFFLVIGLLIGAAAGSVVSLIIDRLSVKRRRNVTAQIDDVRESRDRPGS
ncbi:hypothetical protein IEE91_02710 [Kocuria sp. cx-455]|uniref:YtxH domain-containing protein n=1 Tax=Kocuria sp. cx-455 TaxID=2771377 RepID=UPI00168A052F|nr:YtxH domain-containing protein [Kocuria sp. cx-455]MBD2764120.1 hypothetical protein [Kocuria sp. cx-455]